MHTDPITPPPARADRRRGPRARLADALLALSGPGAHLTDHAEKGWASITFAGTRHRVTLVWEGPEAVERGECFIAFLPEHEFAIPGQLVADAAVTEAISTTAPPRLTVTAEILMLEEG